MLFAGSQKAPLKRDGKIIPLIKIIIIVLIELVRTVLEGRGSKVLNIALKKVNITLEKVRMDG